MIRTSFIMAAGRVILPLVMFGIALHPSVLSAAAVIDVPGETVIGSAVEEDAADLSPGAVTVIRPDEKKGEQKDLPDLLETVPGLRVIRLHGRHGYSVASVRGSTSAQVAVYVDGVLANLQSEAAVDLSSIPIDNVERIEVYRGYIPAKFGAQAMGGVINIITKTPTEPETTLSVGVGSFGRMKASIAHSAQVGNGKLFAAADLDRSDGDFTYFNDNGTPYEPTDDYEGKRRDNSFKDTSVMLKWQDDNWSLRGAWTRNDRDLALAAPGLDKQDGSPQKLGALQDNSRLELSVGRRQLSGMVEWGADISYVRQNKDYDSRRGDQLSSIGGAYITKSRYETGRFGWKLDANAPVGDSHFVEMLVEGARETLDVRGDTLYQYLDGIDSYSTNSVEVQLQDTITLDRAGTFLLTPSLRWYRQDGESKATWQFALRKDIGRMWTLKATGGTYSRAPNLYERFGDGAFILPATNSMQWETGKQFDISATWRSVVAGATSDLTLTYFWRSSENLIEFDMESPNFGRYKNIADARVNGAELEWQLEWQKWSLALSGTYLDAVNKTPNDLGSVRSEGLRLPNRPEWSGSMRLTRKLPKGALYVEAIYTGENYGDSSEHTLFDARTVWNIGWKHDLNDQMSLFLGVDDLFDNADGWRLNAAANGPSRMLWYPVEGRYLYATFEYRF